MMQRTVLALFGVSSLCAASIGAGCSSHALDVESTSSGGVSRDLGSSSGSSGASSGASGSAGVSSGSSSGASSGASGSSSSGADGGSDGGIASDGGGDGSGVTDAGGADGGGIVLPACVPIKPWDGSLPMTPGKICSIDGACASAPSIQGDMKWVWASSPSDIWVANETSVIHIVDKLHTQTSGLTGLPWGPGPIHGSSATDVWIGSLHWDGVSLTNAVTTRPPGNFTMLGANDGWSVHGTAMAHWNGVAWVDVATPAAFALKSLAVFAPDDIFAGGGPSLVHWDGATWSNASTPLPAGGTAETLFAVEGHELWTTGDKLRRLVGSTWTTFSTSGAGILQIFKDGSGVVQTTQSGGFASLNGTTFTTDADRSRICSSIATTCRCFGRFVFSPTSDVIVTGYEPNEDVCGVAFWTKYPAGLQGTFSGFSGAAGGIWPRSRLLMASGEPFDPAGWNVTNVDTLVDVTGDPDANDVWASGYYDASNGIVSHWDGATWTKTTYPWVPRSGLHGTAASAWIATRDGVRYFDGATWTNKNGPSGTTGATVWGSGPDFAMVLTGTSVTNTLYVWNGTQWKASGSYVALGGKTRPMLVAVDGKVLVWDGSKLVSTNEPLPGPGRFAGALNVSFDRDDVWAVTALNAGSSPMFWRWKGCWSPISFFSNSTYLNQYGEILANGRQVRAYGGVEGMRGELVP